MRYFGPEVVVNTYTPHSFSEWRTLFRFVTGKDIYECKDEPAYDPAYDAFLEEEEVAASDAPPSPEDPEPPWATYAMRSQPPED